MSATLPPREELRHGLPMSARPGVSPVVPGLGQVNVRAPPPPPRCRSSAFTASHLKPSDNRLSLCPFHGEPAAAARAQPLVGPDSRPSSPGRVRPLVGCPLMRLPRTEAVRVASEPGWSPGICAPRVARQEDSGSPCSQGQSDTWARGSSRRRSQTPWVGARGPPVVWGGRVGRAVTARRAGPGWRTNRTPRLGRAACFVVDPLLLAKLRASRAVLLETSPLQALSRRRGLEGDRRPRRPNANTRRRPATPDPCLARREPRGRSQGASRAGFGQLPRPRALRPLGAGRRGGHPGVRSPLTRRRCRTGGTQRLSGARTGPVAFPPPSRVSRRRVGSPVCVVLALAPRGAGTGCGGTGRRGEGGASCLWGDFFLEAAV